MMTIKTFISVIALLLACITLHAQTPVDIYLIGGQSNATGQGRVANIPQSFIIDKEVLLFCSKYTNRGERSMQWQPLCPASESTDRFGVEVSMGTALHKLYPERKIALIKHGLSGSNLYSQWNPGNRPDQQQGPEYTKFIETVAAGVKALEEQGYTPVIKAMVWQQGEADARELAGDANNAAYGRNLKNFIEQVRKDVNCKEMPFIYGKVLPLSAQRFPGRQLVKEAQYLVSEAARSELSVKNAILVEADDLQMLHADYLSPNPKDDVHLGTFGLLTLGERFARAIEACEKASANAPQSPTAIHTPTKP